MNPNYPAGFTQREHDQAFTAGNFLGSATICPTCKREIEERYTEMFYVDDRRCTPVSASDGSDCCSQKCLSQHEYSRLCPADQDALKEMARAAYAWFIGTGTGSLKWKLQHSQCSRLVDSSIFRDAEMGMAALLTKLCGEDFLTGDEGPAWFEQAVGLLAEQLPLPVQAAKPEEFVGCGLEVAR